MSLLPGQHGMGALPEDSDVIQQVCKQSQHMHLLQATVAL